MLLCEGYAASRKGTKMMQHRITRQSGGNYNNYQLGQIGAYALRGGGASSGGVSVVGGGSATQQVARPNAGSAGVPVAGAASGHGSFGGGGGGNKLVFKNAARPVGVGAYTFGGAASGRPAYGPTFGISTGGTAGRPQFGVGSGAYGPQNIGRPQQNAIYRGAGGRPGPGLFPG